MKNTLNEATFILMCIHIATFNKRVKIRLVPHVFNDYKGVPFSGYKHRATKMEKAFELSREEFDDLQKKLPCYICNRMNTKNHCNGVDRIDNNEGYTLENSRTCCGDCNLMKKILSHEDFLTQVARIAKRHKDRLQELLDSWSPSRFTKNNENKLSKEEREKLSAQKKENRFAQTQARYTEEAIQARSDAIRKKNEERKNIENDSRVKKDLRLIRAVDANLAVIKEKTDVKDLEIMEELLEVIEVDLVNSEVNRTKLTEALDARIAKFREDINKGINNDADIMKELGLI
jgi:hypothetical protein